jgi:hypothetical protein
MFMPREAARDFVKIKDVRPERLQEITEEDCLKEGIIFAGGCYWTSDDGIAFNTPQEAYAYLWDTINPKYPFSSLPWVWRYEFEKCLSPKSK